MNLKELIRKKPAILIGAAAVVVAVVVLLIVLLSGGGQSGTDLSGSGNGASVTGAPGGESPAGSRPADAQPQITATATPAPESHTAGEYTYCIREDGTAMLTNRSDSGSGAVTLPEELDGIPVTGLMGSDVSDYCSATSVTIPASITHIEGNFFWNWEQLSRISAVEGHPTLESIDGVLFRKEDHTLLAFPPNWSSRYNTTEYHVPNGTLRIGRNAFSGATLNAVRICDSVTELEPRSFWGLRARSISVGAGIRVLPADVFNISGLRTLVLYEGLEVIEPEAMAYCSEISEIMTRANRDGLYTNSSRFPESLRTVGDRAFVHSYSLTSIVFPEGVTAIGSHVFSEQCDSTRRVTLPRSLQSIGENAFGWSPIYTVYRGSYAAAWCESQTYRDISYED